MSEVVAKFDTSEVDRALANLPREFNTEVRKRALPAIGALLSAESSSRAPIRTGFLAIDTAFHRVEGMSVTVGHTAFYAAAVHQRHRHKKQFLLRALVETGRTIVLGSVKRAHDAITKERLQR
jgi:hypothetical protein